jgi:hypothetical protein
MDKKIEMFAGWDWDSSLIVGSERNEHLPNRCTVVIHDDKAERVFTESEVRSMFDAALARMAVYKASGSAILASIAKDHGIVLDPA